MKTGSIDQLPELNTIPHEQQFADRKRRIHSYNIVLIPPEPLSFKVGKEENRMGVIKQAPNVYHNHSLNLCPG